MKKRLSPLALSFFLILSCLIANGCAQTVKEPSVAGTFYPSDKKELHDIVDMFLASAPFIPHEGKLLVLISPHAGYRYSGGVAAHGYKQLQNLALRRIILIGQSHHEAFRGASVYTSGSFGTPLGTVKIDTASANKLLDENADVRYYPQAFAKEHSLEVQLPFLQSVVKSFTIVPIILGSPTKKTYNHLVSALSEMMDEQTLIVASTDLSHYHSYQRALEMDGKVINAIERLSLVTVGELIDRGESEMCGAIAAMIAMEVAKRRGADRGVLFRYANSGDVIGEKERVVGYASIGLFASPLNAHERNELLSLARSAIATYVQDGRVIEPEINNPKLRSDGAVFVTIKEKGALRGCIGHVQAVMPLYQSVIKNAIAAAISDPRFPPLRQSELKDIEVEISILSPLQKLKKVEDIEIGKHGLVIRKGFRSGLLLPQVPVEQRWDRKTFLAQICTKAGLPEDAWKDSELYIFTADTIK